MNTIETKPMCASWSNLEDMLTTVRGWTQLILEVTGQRWRSWRASSTNVVCAGMLRFALLYFSVIPHLYLLGYQQWHLKIYMEYSDISQYFTKGVMYQTRYTCSSGIHLKSRLNYLCQGELHENTVRELRKTEKLTLDILTYNASHRHL